MIYLDTATKRRLHVVAQKLHVSEAQVVRDALHAHLEEVTPRLPRVIGRSADGGVARKLHKALAEYGFGR